MKLHTPTVADGGGDATGSIFNLDLIHFSPISLGRLNIIQGLLFFLLSVVAVGIGETHPLPFANLPIKGAMERCRRKNQELVRITPTPPAGCFESHLRKIVWFFRRISYASPSLFAFRHDEARDTGHR